jgi:hypothetical protein
MNISSGHKQARIHVNRLATVDTCELIGMVLCSHSIRIDHLAMGLFQAFQPSDPTSRARDGKRTWLSIT